MAKGVKKIKKLSNSSIFGDYYDSGDIICINPNQEASFVVGEWYNETTQEERRNIYWLWMDYNKIKSFKETRKPAGEPYGFTLPKKLCGNYVYYLETSLNGGHDPRNTGVYVFGKCEKKITSSSWSKKQNTADNSQINYGQDLFITLETEGLNGDTLTLELYSKKGFKLIDSVKEKCIDGILKGKFKIKSFYREFPGLPETLENFYIKVINVENVYIKNTTGSDKILSFDIIKIRSIITIPVFEIPTNTAPLTIDTTPVEEIVKTEGIIAAYFAKEEFSLETSETAGQHTYMFKNAYSRINKDVIAPIIKKRVDAEVKADKKYAKLDDIKNALTSGPYIVGTPVSFNLCKLGANYIKINNAPLEEEVYVVAKTFLLDGKEVSITIKEKETILVGENADMTVLEAKENGEELTTLKAIVENNIAKVKVKLRPKADEDLKVWKEKLLKGKKEESYTYTFKSEVTTITDENKKEFAGIILKNAKEGKQGNTKIAAGKTAFVDDVEKELQSGSYIRGAKISFDTYKTQAESLWLKAECQGETIKHEGDFLKRDGEYFVIGKKCECEARVRAFMRTIRVAEGTGEYIKGTKDARDPQLGYTTWFSGAGNNFKLSDDHPRTINHNSTETIYSSAAGAYQIMAWKYDELNGYKIEEHNGTYRTVVPKVHDDTQDKAKKYGAKGFSQESQDKLCVSILKTLGTIDLLLKNDIKGAISKSSGTWVSLPGATAGQPTAKMQETLDYYNEFLKDELNEVSNLHLKKGFLKEFDIKCNCDKISSAGNWHEPVDNPIATIFTQSQVEGQFNHSGKHWGLFGDTRSGSPHAGLDLFAKKGTNIYACVDGTVYNRRWHASYGNTITIKVKDKDAFFKFKKDYKLQYKDDGEIKEGNAWSEDGNIFLFYAHLDSVKEYNFNDEVKCGEILGTTGRSGVTEGTCAPHLHFEILCDYTMKVGHKFRLNSGFYVNFKSFDQQSEEEKLEQQTEAKRGKIIEFEGQKKLDYDNIANFKK